MTPVAKLRPARTRFSLILAAFLLPALIGLTAQPAAAQNTIKVLVNDEPITSYDIQQRTQMIRTFTRGKQGKKQAISQLIDEHLMLQEAARHSIKISDADVNAEFASRARAVKLTPSQFQQAMRHAGFDPQTFKNFLRANLAWSQVVRGRFRATVNVSDRDVAAALSGNKQDPKAQQQDATEYRLQQIIFVVPRGSNAAFMAKQKRAADSFRAAFKGCDQSLKQAADKPGIVVKPPIRREEGQLPADMKAKLASLAVGAATRPEQVPEGIQILAICAKNKIAGQTEAEVKARQDVTNEKGQMLARRYLRDLRSNAIIEYR